MYQLDNYGAARIMLHVFEYWAFIYLPERDGMTGGPYADQESLNAWLRTQARYLAREGFEQKDIKVTAFRVRKRHSGRTLRQREKTR